MGTIGVVVLALTGLFFCGCHILRREGVVGKGLSIAVGVLALSLVLRYFLLPHETYDYLDFLSQWVAYFRAHGGFAALGDSLGDYNVPYLYILAAISYAPISDLYLIKLVSVAFDLLLAWGGLRLAKGLCAPQSPLPIVVFCALLLLPTVVLSGAYWGQCDVIYGALVLHSLAALFQGKPKGSVAMVAVAFSFKLQTIFVLPMWCAFWLLGRIKFRHLLLFPATYGVTILPALLLGRPLGEILGVYLNQTTQYTTSLTFNAPSIFAFLPYGWAGDMTKLATWGIVGAFMVVLLILLALFLARQQMTNQILLTATALMAVGVPFFLPYMHERYFFLGDVLTLVLVCTALFYVVPVLLVQLASVSAYAAYLTLQYTAPILWQGQYYLQGGEALLMSLALVTLTVAFIRQTQYKNPPKSIDLTL